MQRILLIIILINIIVNAVMSQNEWSTYVSTSSYVSISHLHHPLYTPDGHISVLPDTNDQYVMYWSEFENSRTIGATQFPESQQTLEPENPVFGGREPNDGTSNGVNDGGAWLMSVHRHVGDTLIGFYHGESHWYPRNGDFTAWKSICVAYSYDNGYTWADSGQIVTSHEPKPEERAWGGAGDCCVIWDSVNQRWNCYYQEHNIRLAVSYDPMGAPGTWKKYYNGSFDEDGMGGLSTPLNNLSNIGGANPSVHHNTHLNKMVLTYHGWDGAIYLSVSADGVTWDYPRKIISKGEDKNWYPTIIGVSDTEAGRVAKIYYGEFTGYAGYRKMAVKSIIFDTVEVDYGYIHSPWKGMNIGNYNFSGKAGMKNEIITITGTTNILHSNSDELYFLYQEVKDSFEISSMIQSQTAHNNLANSGLMIRSSIESGSPFISVSRKSNTDTIEVIRREVADEDVIVDQYVLNRAWMKMIREVNKVDVLTSDDGETWDVLSSYTISLSESSFAGLFSTSHENTVFCTSKFSNTNLIINNIVNTINIANADSKFKIFPNPVNNRLNIISQEPMGNVNYKVLDVFGRMVLKGTLNKELVVIDTSSLQKGQSYILHLFGESFESNAKLIFKN